MTDGSEGDPKSAASVLAGAFGFAALALMLILTSATAVRAQSPPSSPSPRDKKPMISLVVLSKSFTPLDAGAVGQKLDALYPGKFVPPKQQANFVAGGPSPKPLLIKSTIPGRSGIFVLLNLPGPYTDFSDFPGVMKDPAFRRKAEVQGAWLSVDSIGKIGTDEDAYRFIAAALAKLAPQDATILVKPATNTAIVFDDALRRQLADGQAP